MLNAIHVTARHPHGRRRAQPRRPSRGAMAAARPRSCPMIGRLWGLVAEVGEEEALIDVSGVGYVVRCGSRTLGRMPAVGKRLIDRTTVESQWGSRRGL